MRIYKKLIADSEELDEIKEYKFAKTQSGEAIPFDQAFQKLKILYNNSTST